MRDGDKFSQQYTVGDIYRLMLNARGHNPSVADESVREKLEIQLHYQSPRLDYENRNLLACPFTSTIYACICEYSHILSDISLLAFLRERKRPFFSPLLIILKVFEISVE